MGETRTSEGKLVTLEFCTALSNIAAGTPVALITGTTTIGTLGLTVAGVSATAPLGHQFVGVLDESVSAGQTPITVWTEGVFKFTMSSAATLASIQPGWPVAADSGTVVTTPVVTGDQTIGTLVTQYAGWAATGSRTVEVAISPSMWRWDRYVPANTASAVFGNSTPYITH